MPYIGKSPTGSAVRQRYHYTASGSETSLSGADDNGKTLSFTDGEYVDVYLNGVLLQAGVDYGTGTANTIDSLAALTAGQIVEIVVYDVYNVAEINRRALRTRYVVTASGGETSISGTDDNGATITFSANDQIEVNLNGVALIQDSDFNTNTANTVGGLSALSASDVVQIIKYERFILADTVSKAAGGTFGGAIAATSFTGDGSGLTGINPVAVIADQKAYNADGGSSSAGFNDRDLNTEIFDPDGIVSISSNQFTLNAGTYIIEFSSPSFKPNRMFTELYDVTNTASVGQGMTRYGVNTYNGEVVSTGYARVTPTASTIYKIRTYCQNAQSNNGLGVSHDVSGNNNIYTQVKITKLG